MNESIDIQNITMWCETNPENDKPKITLEKIVLTQTLEPKTTTQTQETSE